MAHKSHPMRRTRTPGYMQGWGEGLKLKRRDLRFIRKAITQGWDIPEYVKLKIIKDIREQINTATPTVVNEMILTIAAMEDDDRNKAATASKQQQATAEHETRDADHHRPPAAASDAVGAVASRAVTQSCHSDTKVT